jgi:hypothetical protein
MHPSAVVRKTSDTDGIDEPAYEPHELAAKLREVLDGRAPIIPHSVAFYSRDHFWRNTIAPRRSRPADIDTTAAGKQVIGFVHILTAQNVPHRGRFLPRRASSDTDSPSYVFSL